MGLVVQLAWDGLVLGCIYALVALGFALILATTRVWHFAHAGVYASTAYLAFFLVDRLRQPFWLAALLSVPFAAALGALVEVGLYRPLRTRGSSHMAILIASLATMTLIENVIAILFGADPQSLGSVVTVSSYSLGPLVVTSWGLLTIGLTVALFALLILFQRYSRPGVVMRAVGNNIEMAQVVGIDLKRAYLWAMVLGSALAAPAAILIGVATGINPTMGFSVLLLAVTSVIVGGLGSVPGALLGALFIGLLQGVGIWKIPTEWQSSIAFAVLFLFIVFRPNGILGRKLRASAV